MKSFWRAFAQAYGGTQDLWPAYKYQVDEYINYILTHEHQKKDLYLAMEEGSRNVFTGAAYPDEDLEVEVEMYQVVADLYDIELIVVEGRTGNPPPPSYRNPYLIIPRDQPNRRQIFLGFEPLWWRYQSLRPTNLGRVPHYEFRFIYYAPARPINRCPYVREWIREPFPQLPA